MVGKTCQKTKIIKHNSPESNKYSLGCQTCSLLNRKCITRLRLEKAKPPLGGVYDTGNQYDYYYLMMGINSVIRPACTFSSWREPRCCLIFRGAALNPTVNISACVPVQQIFLSLSFSLSLAWLDGLGWSARLLTLY